MDYKDSDPVVQDLKELLVQFTVSCLTENSEDIIDYAVLYFKKLQRVANAENDGESLDSSRSATEPLDAIEKELSPDSNRRAIREVYHPEASSSNLLQLEISKTVEQRAFLFKALRKFVLFKNWEEETLHKIIDRMANRRVQRDEYIYYQGEEGDSFYLIGEGQFEIIMDNQHIETYLVGRGFGELALLHPSLRAVSVRALMPGILWSIDRQSFKDILHQVEYQKRIDYEQLLDHIYMFKSLNQDEKIYLSNAIVKRSFEKGEMIYGEGDEVDGIYFIQKGSVSVNRTMENGLVVKLLELCEGHYFGEIGFITRARRPVSIYANDNVKTAFLDVSAFDRLIGSYNNLYKRRCPQAFCSIQA